MDVGGWIEADSLDDALSGDLEGRAGWQLANQRLFDAASAYRTVSNATQGDAHPLAAAAGIERHKCCGTTDSEVARTPRYFQEGAAGTTRHTWDADFREELVGLERCSQIASEEIRGG